MFGDVITIEKSKIKSTFQKSEREREREMRKQP